MSFLTNWLTDGDTQKQMPDWDTNPLPKPPIPSLEHTLERYLQYASVVRLWDRIPVEDVEGAVGRFFPIAEKLQEELKEIAEKEDNWINYFWLETMYLRPRYPLPVNSNPAYIFPRQVFYDEDDWLLFTAWLTHGMLQFKDLIDRRAISNDSGGLARGRVPYCMDQYDRLLSIYRQPGSDCDVHLNDRYKKSDTPTVDQHLLIMCENQPFILFVRRNGYTLGPTEMALQMREIVRKARNRSRINVTPIAAATAGNRNDAAEFWTEMLSLEQNENSVKLIQNATFVVCLDGYVAAKNSHERQLETAGDLILHGFGRNGEGLNRWYDSTIQLIVSLDGFNGLCIEHSVAEGIVIIRMMEHVLRNVRNEREPRVRLPSYEGNDQHHALKWVVSESNQKLLDRMSNEFDSLAMDLRLTVYQFKEFGKEFIKSNRISPDGFVQLALQLAHYRQHGYLVSSYESATMRRYRYGRVDNIRSATPEALAWVTAQFNRNVSPQEKNVNGFGIDNHLCALENLAREAVNRGRLSTMPEIFEQQTYVELTRFPLSTSQVTPDPTFEGCYLCYGPVVEDGYGCAYSIQANELLFAISDMKSNSRTSGIGFEAALKESLLEMRYLLESTTAV
ncbi:hypothetical protein M3Y94_00269500 [Aphelenchoides besseyi]|nr:hypothetical protein M3Y94_00269500 [Aphelenchoides besseyi]